MTAPQHLVSYIGDAVTAAGFRLAGVTTHTPRAGEETAAFEHARGESSVVLVSTECARRIPRAVLEGALGALAPLVLIVPEDSGSTKLIDPAGQVRRELGLEA